jgi:hypothetical protein
VIERELAQVTEGTTRFESPPEGGLSIEMIIEFQAHKRRFEALTGRIARFRIFEKHLPVVLHLAECLQVLKEVVDGILGLQRWPTC